MGEEVQMSDYQDDERVTEWEMGLPAAHDLTPLSQLLIPPELASAFKISPEPYRTLVEVNRASRSTLSTLRGGANAFSSSANNNNNNNNNNNHNHNLNPFHDEEENDPGVGEEETDPNGSGSDSRKLLKIDCAEEADSALRNDAAAAGGGGTLKRPRLVWTPQLHKRFVDVVAHLGIKNAVPKTIMQLMNVEGLTRENVASHLQKYRLYVKRMQGLSAEGPSSSDHLFASTPVSQSLNESGGGGGGGGGSGHSRGNGHLPVPMMPYPPPPMMPMPVFGMPHGHGGYLESHSYLQQRDWSANKYASAVSYPHVAPNDK